MSRFFEFQREIITEMPYDRSQWAVFLPFALVSTVANMGYGIGYDLISDNQINAFDITAQISHAFVILSWLSYECGLDLEYLVEQSQLEKQNVPTIRDKYIYAVNKALEIERLFHMQDNYSDIVRHYGADIVYALLGIALEYGITEQEFLPLEGEGDELSEN